MSQLNMAASPGFVDTDETLIDADSVLTDDVMIQICQNAKFAAVRCERIFMGFFKNGDTVGTPSSPVDGYAYSQEEILYDYSIYSSRAPAADFVSGQGLPPSISSSQPANTYWWRIDIDDATGQVLCEMSYYKQGGAETISHDGILKVYALCQRQSVNTTS